MTPQTHTIELQRATRKLKQDPLLGSIIKKHGPCTLKPNWKISPYHSLLRAIVFQQLNGKAAENIFHRLVAALNSDTSPTNVLNTCSKKLRAAGLSQQKLGYIRALASAAKEGLIPTHRRGLSQISDEALVRRYTVVHGIGEWTVHMFLIFTLGRLDVMPTGDFGVRNGFSILSGKDMPTPKVLANHAISWAPYRSIAAWYLWRATEQ